MKTGSGHTNTAELHYAVRKSEILGAVYLCAGLDDDVSPQYSTRLLVYEAVRGT